MTSRKKKSRVARKGNAETLAKRAGENGQKAMRNAAEAFASMSLGEAPTRSSEIPEKSAVMEDQSTTCSSSNGSYEMGSSSSSSSNASDIFGLGNGFLQDEFKQKSRAKMKRVVATAGTVSTMLGKDYVRSLPKKGASKTNGFFEQNWSKEEAEQFLCSMLGDDCELSLAVVSDVLCQCGYNLDKSLLGCTNLRNCHMLFSMARTVLVCAVLQVVDGTSDSTYRSSFVEPDNVWFSGDLFWDNSKISQSSGSCHSSEKVVSESELPQKVLQSLFNMPTPKAAEQEPNKMNWRNIVKKMVSLGQGFTDDEIEQKQQHIHAKGDDYHVLREAAHEHWDSMKSYYQKAVTAFSSGERAYASYLSEQGKLQNKKAREADVKASQDIFAARNRSIENMITIDLHGQHIKQAMKVLKLHLLFGAYVRSVKLFRVITGCGSHGVGKSKLKTSVIGLLQKEGIRWSEENRGTLLVRLEGQTDFSFLDSGSGSDCD
ncbi:SMR domain-containing protein At5g58720 isoform X2 [Salvia miltiorrhiza]|uniref:SMR domain-containing protein At5g58720 isoform X2 n=1 Tax=Salvia miltiorrhiza TaxID=226208 RepID=UPI0025AD5E43|nr:SMR domain-containing protein At5g58720 isoform X2 [Salvia miltiorrhiza]